MGIILIMNASQSIKAAESAVMKCLTVIIPSLFGFMAISGFLVRTGLYRWLGTPFCGISKAVFGLPPELFAVFLISNIGGYPIGAIMLSRLCKSGQISRSAAEVAQCFCYSSGPAFILGTVGITIFGSSKIGMILFLSCFISNIISAILLGNIFRKEFALNKKIISDETLSYANELVASITAVSVSLAEISAVIVAFSLAVSTLEYVGFIPFAVKLLSRFNENQYIKQIFVSFIEITNISYMPNYCYAFLPLIAGMFSFGGICVLIQIFTTVKNTYSIKYLIISRIPMAILSYYSCKILLSVSNYDVTAAAVTDIGITYCDISPIPSVFLLIMTILLLSKKSLAKL